VTTINSAPTAALRRCECIGGTTVYDLTVSS
jgi:hypothetical protein